MKERKKNVKKEEERFVERGVVDEGEGWRRRERGNQFYERNCNETRYKIKFPNLKVSNIIYNNYFHFIYKKIQIIKINYVRIKN